MRGLLFIFLTSTLSVSAELIPKGSKINRLPLGLKEFRNIEVLSVNPESMTIRHDLGVDQIFFEDLGPELQERMGYDPIDAKKYRVRIEQERLQREQFEAAKRAQLQSERSHSKRVTGESPVHVLREVDLRPIFRNFDTASKDQGRRPSCSVFAVVSALEYEYFRLLGSTDRLSEEFLIWATMQRVGSYLPQINDGAFDAGFSIRTVFEALIQYGIVTEEIMPNTFGVQMQDIEAPEPEILERARERRATISVQAILSSDRAERIKELIKALNRQRPVVIGMILPPHRNLKRTFVLDSQTPVESYRHAVTLVGYSNATGQIEDTRFYFKNSWGLDWGIQGYGIVSFNYLEQHLNDAYVIEVVGEIEGASAENRASIDSGSK